ncbi:uncharacterized protein [Halyomorpha halys]|uniref:uncharacterized protein n=1 Tax=Halyomorpha halys TaxID=286706 RepID=UPI0034D2D6A1
MCCLDQPTLQNSPTFFEANIGVPICEQAGLDSSTSPEQEMPPLLIEHGPAVLKNSSLIESGNYVVNGQHFYKAIRTLELHKLNCSESNNGYMELISSSVADMVWKMEFRCSSCQEVAVVRSQSNEKSPAAVRKSDNLTLTEKAVWGFASIGSGHENMEEVLTSMEIKPVCAKTFRRCESKLGQKWRDMLFESMSEAGRAERDLAIRCGDITDSGVPFITVIVDGGWSHRSHGHRYTANSGVACVIGAKTKKLLDLGVRNKYCSMCEYRKARNLDPGHDNCFKNWDGPSSSMETDMLVKSFQRSKELHGLEYHTLVGDGDSSVYFKLKTSVLYGRAIEKIECANHAIKNYTKRLFAIQKESLEMKKTFNINIIKRLKTAARGAIIHHCENKDVNSLKDDLRNGPHHVFGIHISCKPYFCTKCGETTELNEVQKNACDKARFVLQPLIAKSSQLVTNMTSNAAENYMALVAKFTGGKQINRGKRGSFTHRTNAAALDFQLGPNWHYQAMKTISNKSPAAIVKRTGQKRERTRISCRRSLFLSRMKQKNKTTAKTSKEQARKIESGSHDYGEMAMQLDMEENEMQALKVQKLKQLSLSAEEIAILEINTRGQRENEKWHAERKDRLTASNFGLVCKRRSTSKWSIVAKKLLYDQYRSRAMEYGTENELKAIEHFQKKTGLTVDPCGLFVHSTYGFLGASPDGLVGADSIIEVKCPKSAEKMTIREACEKLKKFYIDKNTLKLKENSDYYFQIQGQLQITGRNTCYFVVWTPKDLHYEIIKRNDDFWETFMIRKLIFCYKEVILPELLDPRLMRSLDIREPDRTKF